MPTPGAFKLLGDREPADRRAVGVHCVKQKPSNADSDLLGLVLGTDQKRIVDMGAEYRADTEASAALGLVWHLLVARSGAACFASPSGSQRRP